MADVRERLAAARRPVVWAGAGILRRDRGGEAIALAERLGAPVVESVMGKGAVDETHPLVAGVYSGASSDAAVRRMVERADLVLELGVDINDINTGAFTLGVKEERRVLADHTGLRVGHRDYPGVTLDDLLDGLRRRPPRRGGCCGSTSTPTTRHGRCARWARGSSSSCTRPTEGRRAPSPRRPPAAGAPRWSA